MTRKTWMVLLVAGCGQLPPSSSGPDNRPLLPAPDRGVQLSIGPFDVPAGQEIQICQTLKLSNDEPMAINRIQMAKRTGSHHTILFTSDMDVPDQTFMCWGTVNFDDWHFMVDSQSEDFDWTLPEGKAYVLKPHQQIMIQAHYQNATHTQSPQGGYVTTNLYATNMIDPTDIKDTARGMFTVNRRIDLPPNSHGVTFTRDCIFNQNAYVFGIYGHFHSRGRKFTVDYMNSEGYMMQHLYQSLDWENMQFLELPSQEIPGDGQNGVLVAATEALRFSCTYDNDTNNEIVFGSHADVQEHCNLFFHYALQDPTYAPVEPGTLLTCTNGSGSW
jgi:Copper type II ascorbate-dependent monooxygenase, C-terminal domain